MNIYVHMKCAIVLTKCVTISSSAVLCSGFFVNCRRTAINLNGEPVVFPEASTSAQAMESACGTEPSTEVEVEGELVLRLVEPVPVPVPAPAPGEVKVVE